MQLCQSQMVPDLFYLDIFEDFTLDKHFNDLFLKGTVADQKTCGIPAWPVNLWPFIPTGKARLLHSPREKRMCWPVPSLEPIEQHVHVIPHVTSTILHEHHLKKITKVVEIFWVIIHNNAGILYFNIHLCSYALSLSSDQKKQWEIPKSKTLSPQTSQPRRRQLCPPDPAILSLEVDHSQTKSSRFNVLQCKENDRFHTFHTYYHPTSQQDVGNPSWLILGILWRDLSGVSEEKCLQKKALRWRCRCL